MTQIVLSLFAFVLGPPAFRAFWEWLRYSIKAELRPVHRENHADQAVWEVEFSNKSYTRLQSFDFILYPRGRNRVIGFAAIVDEQDGSFQLKKAALDRGALDVSVDRLGPRRSFTIELKLNAPSVVRVQGITRSIDTSYDYSDVTNDRESWDATVKMRLMVLMLYYAFGVFFIIMRMVYLGFFG